MFFKIYELFNTLAQYKKIIIYGAGAYAREIFDILCRLGWKEKIQCFVVTKREKEEPIDGICVCQLGQIKIDGEQTAILISVSQQYENKIVAALEQNYSYDNIYKITEYITTDEDRDNILANAIGEELADPIVEWFINRNPMDIYRIHEIRRLAVSKFRQHKEIKTDTKQLVFVVGNFLPRIAKCLSALSAQKEFDIAVISIADASSSAGKREIEQLGIKIDDCESTEETLYKMLDYKPALYYIDPPWGNCLLPAIAIRNKQIYGKIILALYDVLNDGYYKIDPKLLRLEKYSLENADGTVWRYFSEEDLKQKKGFNFRGKSIQFLDFCGDYPIDSSEQKCEEDKVKICLVASQPRLLLQEPYAECEYIVEAKIGDILKRIGNREDCEFHLYSWFVTDEDKRKLNILEKQYKNFKVFLHIEHKKLIQCISTYDYGSLLYTSGKIMPDTVSVNGLHTGGSYKNASTNRYFDYLDAELPIITTAPVKFCDYLEKYQVVVKMDINNINILQLIKEKRFYKKKAKLAKKKLSIYRQIPKLQEFIKSVIESRQIG